MMEEVRSRPASFTLLGGRVCLDFANTVGNHASASPQEKLRSYAELVEWGRQAGVVTGEVAAELLGEAERHPERARAVLARAVALREAIFRIFSAVAGGLDAAGADLEVLNRELAGAMRRARIIRGAEGFSWDFAEGETALDRVLWPVARSAAELLVSGELARVRECADDVCGWLFLDMSKNQSRRWCAMKDCGNQAKSRRHYARKKREVSGS